MDLFNRPPSISEDTLQYTLHPPDSLSDRPATLTLATLIHEFVQTLLPDFLWHRDPFQLKVEANPDGNGYILEGIMRFGDCVDDEWCVVWLLREISRKWDLVIRCVRPHAVWLATNVLCSVADSDGEFLLIEAAESLPSWVTPSNAENRVRS
jgi:SGT1 protein